MQPHSSYRNPLQEEYVDSTMKYLFSEENRSRIWRAIWVAIAEAEYELGLPVEYEQVHELRCQQNEINFEYVAELQSELGESMPAHRLVYAEQCQIPEDTIQLSVSDDFVIENAHLMIVHEALKLLKKQIYEVLSSLTEFAERKVLLLGKSGNDEQCRENETMCAKLMQWIRDFIQDIDRVQHVLASCSLRELTEEMITDMEEMKKWLPIGCTIHDLGVRTLQNISPDYNVSKQQQADPQKCDLDVMDVLRKLSETCIRFISDLYSLALDGSIMLDFNMVQNDANGTDSLVRELVYGMNLLAASVAWTSALRDVSGHWSNKTYDSTVRQIIIPEAFLSVSTLLRFCLESAVRLQTFRLSTDDCNARGMQFETLCAERGEEMGAERMTLPEALLRGVVEEIEATAKHISRTELHEGAYERPGVDFNPAISLNPSNGNTVQRLRSLIYNEVGPMLSENVANADRDARILL